MVNRDTLLAYLNTLLSPQLFNDYGPNGLQVEGKDDIATLITGVTANQALFNTAIQQNADAILVHHGCFWQEEDRTVVGFRKVRLALLLNNNINLFAYHLPLDAHPELGNNAQLAHILNIKITGSLYPEHRTTNVGNIGVLTQPCQVDMFAANITHALNRKPLHIPGASEKISKVAWCTGGGKGRVEAAIAHGVDAYITGEISEATVHIARETGIHLFAAGHHATERFGVQAVGKVVAKEFGIVHRFIDIENPV